MNTHLTLVRRREPLTPRVPEDHELEGLLHQSIQQAAARKPMVNRVGHMVHHETHEGFEISVYQIGLREFYFRTECERPNQHGGQRRRSKRNYKSKESATEWGRRAAHKRALDIERHPSRPEDVPMRYPRPPKQRRIYAVADAAKVVLEHVPGYEPKLEGHEATCPVCERTVSRDFMALHTHLMAHVRKKLITLDRKKEIQSQLQIRRRKGVA